MAKTAIVLPCFNEGEVLLDTLKTLQKKVGKTAKIICVDDGSTDDTWKIIEKQKGVIGVKLSTNVGQQNALMAGLMFALENKFDVTISMDADLQDDISVIDEMLKQYKKGFDIVYGVRANRKKDSFFKRRSAKIYYRLLRLMGVKIMKDVADCRLMNRKALECLREYREVNLFLRGVVPLIGLKTTTVSYDRQARRAGRSKYTPRKMFHLAWDGITSFSTRPLRLIFDFGILAVIVGIGVSIYAVVQYILGQTVPGWTFIICSIWLLSGAILMGIGLVGEYIGKIYLETKQRPRYFIEKVKKK